MMLICFVLIGLIFACSKRLAVSEIKKENVSIVHLYVVHYTLVDNHMYKCSAQFANVSNFEIALCKLEIVKLQTNFEIAQPSLLHFEIAQPSLHNFEIALHKLEIAKLHSAIF